MSLRGGTSLDDVVSELHAWGARALSGSPEVSGLCAPARIAVSTATCDAEAKKQGLPLHRLLSPGSVSEPVPCNATLSAGSPDEVLRQAEEWASDGFETFKLKLTSKDDISQVAAVREGLGTSVRIRIDANESWEVSTAPARLAALEPFQIELAEQPVAGLEAMARLRRESQIMLVADEAVSSTEEAARAAEIGACDAVTVKLSKTGTLDATLGGYLPTYLSSALDGPVGIAAAAHVAQTLPQLDSFRDIAHGLATSRLFASTIAEREARLLGPNLVLPDGPGLGVVIDEKALDRHRL